MNYKLILVVFSFVVRECISQNINPTDCTITYDGDDGNGGIDWGAFVINTNTILDTGTLDLSYTFTNDLKITANGGDVKYIDTKIDGQKLIIRTTPAFTSDFEEDHISDDPVANLFIVRRIDFSCNGGRNYSFTLRQYVQDTNNHPPTFFQDIYEYMMPMPLVSKIDLTGFGVPIVVQDLDFSNTDVTFTLDRDDFVLTTEKPQNRQYRAILKAKDFVRFTNDVETITITATDSGTPTSSGTATIKITKDAEFSAPDIPTFPQTIYKYTYSESEGTPQITKQGEDIVITTDAPDGIQVELDGKISFGASFDPSSKIVTITALQAVKPTTESVITLTLTASLSETESAKAAILIYLPRSDYVITAPKFSAPFYTATYTVNDDTHSVTLDQVISVTENADVKVEGDDHFAINNIADTWTLDVANPLDPDTLKEGGEIILTLRATVTEGDQIYEGFGVVVVELPKALEVPQFTEAYYQADYRVVDGIPQITNEEDIIINTYAPESITVALNDEKYFGAEFDPATRTVNITAKQVIEITDCVITLTLTATLSNTVSTKTAILVYQETNSNPLRFIKDIYEYTIPMPLVPGIDLTGFGDQIIAEDIDFSNTDVTFTVDSDYFVMEIEKLDNRQYRVILKVKAEVTYNKISLAITATDNGSPSNFATVTIVITGDSEECSLPEVPEFSAILYKFSYSTDDASITATDGHKIVIISNNPNAMKVTLHDETYFKPIYDACKQSVNISPTGIPVPRPSDGVLTLILTANVGNASSQAVILIDII